MKKFVFTYLLTTFILMGIAPSLFAQKKGKLTPEEKKIITTAKVKFFRFKAPPLYIMPPELKDLSRYADIDADYIIELIIPLMAWKASYSPAKWKQYWLSLGVEVRIIRKSDLTRIWKTNVGYGGLNDKRLKFHINDLEENGKEKISAMLDIAALECSKQIIEKYINAKK